jgi:hypothetical protein
VIEPVVLGVIHPANSDAPPRADDAAFPDALR